MRSTELLIAIAVLLPAATFGQGVSDEEYLDGKKETAAEVVELVRDEASGKLRMEIQPQRSLPLSAQHQPVSVMVHPAWLPVL